MKSLLWREWRWNRLIFVAGLVIFLLPYLIALILLAWPKDQPLSDKNVAATIVFAAVYSFTISQITMAFLSGNAIAGERSDRTAEFLAYLPVSKLERLAAKLSFIAMIAALIWGINWLIIGSLHERAQINIEDFLEFAKYTALTGFVMFGVAWLVSSLQSSPTFAVCAGIIAPILIGFGLAMVVWVLETNGAGDSVDRQVFETGFPIGCLSLGTPGFLGGTWYFLKRVEP